MKTRLIILGLLLAASLFWWLFHNNRQKQMAILPSAIETNQSTPPTPIRQVQTSAVTAVATSPAPTPESDFTAWNEKRLKQMKEGAERAQDEWRTPIEFYGEVVDENTNPVTGAKVDFDCNDTSATGTSFYHTQSDANGLFSIKDIKGKLLGVNVSKEGYYSYLPHGNSFYYAGQNQNFVPDAGNPVVFRLRKKGPGEALIHFNKSFPVPKDGTPIQIDLATGNQTASSQNAFEIECWTNDAEKKSGWKFDWKCQVSVPGGGLQIYDEQFPFLAPEENYVAADEIDMTVNPDVPWTQDIKRSYFIRTGDGKYARMDFRMIAHGDHFCTIDSYFNPSGSRNLEPATP
jgi:hypothetical protein